MLVISYGGSILAPEEIDTGFISRVAELLKKAEGSVYVVVGGGEIAREYIERGRELGANESLLDEIGILATRMNAYLLLSALGSEAYPRVAESIDEAITAKQRIVVMGGTVPGHTTDAVAALLAERLGSKNSCLQLQWTGSIPATRSAMPRRKR